VCIEKVKKKICTVAVTNMAAPLYYNYVTLLILVKHTHAQLLRVCLKFAFCRKSQAPANEADWSPYPSIGLVTTLCKCVAGHAISKATMSRHDLPAPSLRKCPHTSSHGNNVAANPQHRQADAPAVAISAPPRLAA
jgi:hypothetical protein